MTHGNIITKFLIEYDKAEITSSYPSLTDYEIATILDKSYLALIAQKVTGTNFRRAGFESDVKAVEDIRPLIVRCELSENTLATMLADNEHAFDLPIDPKMLYFVEGAVKIDTTTSSLDNSSHKIVPSILMSHDSAQTYKSSSVNLPWIKNPISYLEGDELYVLIDNYEYKKNGDPILTYILTYVKVPHKFVDDWESKTSEFELNDSMAEELINLAIIMSTEIVESTRLQGKINTSALES